MLILTKSYYPYLFIAFILGEVLMVAVATAKPMEIVSKLKRFHVFAMVGKTELTNVYRGHDSIRAAETTNFWDLRVNTFLIDLAAEIDAMSPVELANFRFELLSLSISGNDSKDEIEEYLKQKFVIDVYADVFPELNNYRER